MAAGFAELDLPALTIQGLFSPNKFTVPRTWTSPPGLGPPSPRLDLTPTSVFSEMDRYSTVSASPPQSTVVPTYSLALREGRKRGSTPELDYGGSSASEDDIPARRPSMGSKHIIPGLVSYDRSSTLMSTPDGPFLAPVEAYVTLLFVDGGVFIFLLSDKPPPCTLFYLSNCKHGADCKYGHDYLLNEDHIEEIKQNAKKSPCPAINKGAAMFYLRLPFLIPHR